jgi:hypothetical protein
MAGKGMRIRFPLALGSGAIGTRGFLTCSSFYDQVQPETKKPSFASRRKRVVFKLSPIPPAQDFCGDLHAWVFWLPSRPTLRAFPEAVSSGDVRISLTVTAAGQRRFFTDFPKARWLDSRTKDYQKNPINTRRKMSSCFAVYEQISCIETK